ncbi:MAG: fumarylacetoacetate hydrolase family protein [Chromatiaceae bacterium]|jgi:2-keto-4-pentenoate hydratase/2-oxohepta-3-ene-1,7-dioic acid hydratase in catechol pathway|nr:fumarylacetoacetate hydrolase family protein [Chromatiaceae bacterium]
MRVARCLDQNGLSHWVEPLSADRARLYEGDSPFGGLRPGEREIDVRRWLAPVLPTDIYGVGLNYRAHAAETGADLPDNPVLFMKPSTAVTDPDSPILLPAACEHGPEVDYEAELAVIIGKTARNVAVEDALDFVLGYTCANDVSARRWQKRGGGGQWVRGKSFDTFCPLGPVLVTADEIPDPQGLGIRSVLNGRTMQSSSTADMIFTVAELVAFISRDTTLLPGTAILTGTPEGVGFARTPPVFLSDGDTIEISIDRIGTLNNPVRDARRD